MPRSRRSDRQAGQSALAPSTSPLRVLRGWTLRHNAGDRSRLPQSEPYQSEPLAVPQIVPKTVSQVIVVSESDSQAFFEENPLIISESSLLVYRIPSRPNRRDFVPRILDQRGSRGAAADANVDGRSRDGRAAMRVYQDELTRKESAADRMRAKNARLDQEWEENVRKYGEDEVRRR